MSQWMTSWVCALVASGGRLARRGSSHCPRRSLRLIAVATSFSSGIFGSSSHACGTSTVQTVTGGTWLAGVRSCTGHSGNGLSSQSSRFEVSAFSPHSGSACHAILSCRLPCWPGVASLPFILPRNHTNCFGCPLSVAANTSCTSARSGHSKCMVLRSATVKNGHASGLRVSCGSGGCGTAAPFGSSFGRLARRAGLPAPSGRGLGRGRGCSGAVSVAALGSLQLWKLWKMLYFGPCPTRGRCIPRSLFACSCRLVVLCLRVCSVSLGQDIQRSACVVACLRM